MNTCEYDGFCYSHSYLRESLLPQRLRVSHDLIGPNAHMPENSIACIMVSHPSSVLMTLR
jgi:hypothetical protein